MPEFDYVRDGAEIYRRSFATIRAEAELDRGATFYFSIGTAQEIKQ